MSDEREQYKAERNNALEEQFVKPMPTAGGKLLHPFSGGRRLLLKKLKNELITGKGLGDMEDPDFAVLEFLYLHTLTPEYAPKEVYGDKDKWQMAVYAFACHCTPQLEDEMNAVMEILNRARLADVDVESKPSTDKTDEPAPPPNS